MKAIFSVVLLNLFALSVIVRAGVDSGAAYDSPEGSEGLVHQRFGSQEVFAESSSKSETSRNLVRRDTHPTSNDEDTQKLSCADLDSVSQGLARWATMNTSDPHSDTQVRFYFSSTTNRTRAEIPTGDKLSLSRIDFKPERRTFMVVHGFRTGIDRVWIREMEDALLALGDVNVITVDWGLKEQRTNFYEALMNTREAGNQVARFLQQVVNATKHAFPLNPPKMGLLHLIGYSLGAHVCGIAGHELKRITDDWRVHRITGLDPTDLCLLGPQLKYRLAAGDGDYVDIIHTSSTTNSTTGFGIWPRLGNIDYYLNGGHTQPGCEARANPHAYPKLKVQIGKCSHERSYTYFIETLRSEVEGGCTFWGIPWDMEAHPVHPPPSMLAQCDRYKCSQMGLKSEDSAFRGSFYVYTGSRPPFCTVNPATGN